MLMLALFAVILTSLIGNLLALSRLLFAAGREGDAPRRFAELNGRGIPAKAIGAVAAVSALIPFLGRTAIGWIVDVTTLGATIIYALISHAVWLHAKKNGGKAEKATGIAGMALMTVFLLLLLIPGLLPFHAMETESYFLFIVWALLGLAAFRRLIRMDRYREYGQHVIVWILLLLLVLFASVMWVSRATENAANESVERIHVYHETHPADDSDEQVNAERVAFLQEEANRISSTNILYTVVSLGLFMLCITIMLNNYKDTRVLGQKLSAAEKEAEDARKIAELKQSLTSLLDNMPAISFSKDAETGVYLACNQAFAEYARKGSPEEVVGRTDAELFDEATAKHFVEEDRKALSMKYPHIYLEDALDAAGNPRHLQTTKFRFTDSSGRECVLGMCQDVTSQERIRIAEERAEEEQVAYARLKALNSNYLCVYVADPETGRYREMSAADEYRTFSQAPEGEDFFGTTREEIHKIIHPEDLDRFLKEFTQEKVLEEIGKNGAYALRYRIVLDGRPVHALLKAVLVEEKDGPRLIVALIDVDAQVQQEDEYNSRIAKAKAEASIDALTGIKNKHAYLDAEERLNTEIAENQRPGFSVTVLDVNDLKKINDRDGHQAGDECLRSACKTVCTIFKHSPVFRIGGDEFAVISRGEDYNHIEELLGKVDDYNKEAARTGGIVIACGMSRMDYATDTCVAQVFERADQNMYDNKIRLKS